MSTRPLAEDFSGAVEHLPRTHGCERGRADKLLAAHPAVVL
jgi:hypothetical protein